jgi:host factor-I protein
MSTPLTLNTDLPSVRQIQTYIREKSMVEVKLLTGDLITGSVFWQDSDCINIRDASDQTIMISRPAIAFIRAQAPTE